MGMGTWFITANSESKTVLNHINEPQLETGDSSRVKHEANRVMYMGI